ncbi:3-hydroxy-5-phosphonooxypentane-2,4-dione thiolase [Brachyspira aalborgi]|jgi:putative autoinducer-2 (AI-2) aldolase|uniref:3-hydroxy-5-phosphonooxypentane-2,4-dione thiolase n=1 Tax=Brachyspira aalborgi TaxID=29522 RepID=A0A5C8F0R5_9SPIR|nr:3-hydroxy-5-phosphonooxypentane-2,4-dione thiolase [Brachyspira aalborgi]MBS4762491.1 3-hydroxy-5-phosphonooxypentane-2,4-dione thiolase [Brachyspira sp.]CCY74826.1 deoxyribose-phosphate aldolase/phospho-2-dehydro-3-deoxyheptonate aldolase [Brachyspira sp. CAG:700]TXJ11174.1 3-hydroxy-5-phosphonooxypentane-2,4-dione thiolase [Brachyspira aalborgi]TXJ21491.1 3-hydroxy-5-phosphonooxypentane-2,4-dione thiolase [Brachyspira aalborgi]TXJ32582.1 3-hydroxy-5-phosphonooxypentane-2,4-dione thiolase 
MFNNYSFGKKNRLSKIVMEDGKALMLAIDHGYFMGAAHGMEMPKVQVEKLIPHIDSLMLSPGILTSQIDSDFKKGIVLRASGGNTILESDIDNEGLILSAKNAIKLNASAIAVSMFVGAEHSHQTILNLTDAINDAMEYDLPVLGVTAVGKALKDKKEKRYLTHASRLAAELGADIVKTYYCEGFEEVVKKTTVPIIVAGGPKLDSYKDVLELCYNSIQCGAIGVDMGRNIWQSDYPEAITAGVAHIIHKNSSVKEALQLVESMCNDKTKRKEYFEVTQEDIENSKVH